jgi:hypothetical protein
MKSPLYVAAFLLLAGGASAQTAAPPAPSTAAAAAKFVPITLSQEDVTSMTNYLGTLPYNTAAPIISFLASREAELQAAATKAESAPKK